MWLEVLVPHGEPTPDWPATEESGDHELESVTARGCTVELVALAGRARALYEALPNSRPFEMRCLGIGAEQLGARLSRLTT